LTSEAPLFQISESAGVISIEGRGLFTAEDVASHFRQLGTIISRHHASGQVVRALIDLKGAAIQPMGIATSIAEATNRLYSKPTDRVAILVASSLLKMQLKRIHADRPFEIFISEAEARAFLQGP